jgi:prophage antirepressor-like protein
MEVVKAFTFNTLTRNITIAGTYEKPLFRASDVGDTLDISNIRSSIQNFNSTDKTIIATNTLGGMQDVIFLTTKGLYKVLFKCKKPIGLQFQDWVCEVIDELRLKGFYDMREQITNQQKEIENVQQELQKTQELLKAKEKKKFVRGDTVYIMKDTTDDGKNVYKVGFSSTMDSRMDAYRTSRFTDSLQYEQTCCDGRVLEKVVHHILRRYADSNKKDWFHTSLEIVKSAIVMSQSFLDDCIIPSMSDEDVATFMDEATGLFAKNTCEKEEFNEEIQEEQQEESSEDQPNTDPKIKSEMTSTDIQNKIQAFIDECLVLDENATSKSIDISGLFRMWIKSTASVAERSALYENLRRRFIQTTMWNNEFNVAQVAFQGVRLADYEVFKPSDPPCEYDLFIAERCIISPGARVPMYLMTDELVEWKKERNSECMIHKKENRQFSRYLMKSFVPVHGGFIFQGQHNTGGMHGITLKSHPDVDQCHSTKSLNKKKIVYQIKLDDGSVVKTYGSQSEAANVLGIDVYYYIKHKKSHDGCILTYDNPVEDPST